MKNYKTIPDCIHAYANQHSEKGRCGNVFFYYNKIYSYGHHYCMGEFLDDDTIMINDMGYSVSTSRHISYLRQAVSHKKKFYTTETDLHYVKGVISSLMDKLAKARKPENYIFAINRLWKSINEYHIDYRSFKGVKKDAMYKDIAKMVKIATSDIDKYQEAAKAKAKKDAIKAAKQLKKDVAKFYAYEINRINNKEDFLRISKDTRGVETSQQVIVPFDDAIKLYKAILAKVDIKGFKIGQYIVTSINGTLKIGCHNINMESVHRTGKIILALRPKSI